MPNNIIKYCEKCNFYDIMTNTEILVSFLRVFDIIVKIILICIICNCKIYFFFNNDKINLKDLNLKQRNKNKETE